jgi:hypothetical protein
MRKMKSISVNSINIPEQRIIVTCRTMKDFKEIIKMPYEEAIVFKIEKKNVYYNFCDEYCFVYDKKYNEMVNKEDGKK